MYVNPFSVLYNGTSLTVMHIRDVGGSLTGPYDSSRSIRKVDPSINSGLWYQIVLNVRYNVK